MSAQFRRRKEDFICERCNAKVKGNGYTNHCPDCLWSKHVDIYPGDRASMCGGMMEPQGVGMTNGEWRVEHQCVKCDHRKWNRTPEEDSYEAIFELSQKSLRE